MAATTTKSCQSCGERHVLFLAVGRTAEAGKRFEYICPRKRDRVQFAATSNDGWKPADSKPPGSVNVREVVSRA